MKNPRIFTQRQTGTTANLGDGRSEDATTRASSVAEFEENGYNTESSNMRVLNIHRSG